jgi:hypothetical protein
MIRVPRTSHQWLQLGAQYTALLDRREREWSINKEREGQLQMLEGV